MPKMCQNTFGGRALPGSAGSAPPDPLAAMRGPTSKGKGRGDRGGEGKSERERRGEQGRGGDEGKEWALPLFGSSLRPC